MKFAKTWAGATAAILNLILQGPASAGADGDVSAKVKAAITQLHSSDMIDAVEAGMELGELGKAAVPALIAELDNVGVQYLAASALGDIGADAAPAVPGLLKLLGNDDPEVRAGAAKALGQIKAEPDKAVPALQALAGDPESPVRTAAASSLLLFGVKGAAADNASAGLLDGLNSPQSTTRSETLRFLATEPALAKANMPAIIKAITDENGSTAVEAMRTVASLGADAKDAVPVLIKVMGGSDTFLTVHAIKTLGQIGPAAAEALPALTGLLSMSKAPLDPAARGILAKAAAALGAQSGGTINLAVPAAIAIDLIEPGNKPGRQVLDATLASGPLEYIVDVAEHDLKAGKDGATLVKPLINSLGDGAEHTRRRASHVLAGLGRAEAVPELIKELDWDDSEVQTKAALALGRIGPAARAALPALNELGDNQAAKDAIAKIEAK
jgi:hypothetical protein